MKYPEMKNWKLKEIEDSIEIVALDSFKRINELLIELDIPRSKNLSGMNRSETSIDWSRMPLSFKFFFDGEGEEEKIKEFFEQSILSISHNLIIAYGWQEPMVKVPTILFLEDWEGFFQSAKYETILFSEDYKLIMEVSRDYYLHSNFEIMPNSRIW